MTQETNHLLVRQQRLESDGVLSLTLERPDGAALGEWEPGAHIDIVLPSGTVRQYSLCGDPTDKTAYRIAVLREDEGRGGSKEIHDSVRVGDLLAVRGPPQPLRPRARTPLPPDRRWNRGHSHSFDGTTTVAGERQLVRTLRWPQPRHDGIRGGVLRARRGERLSLRRIRKHRPGSRPGRGSGRHRRVLLRPRRPTAGGEVGVRSGAR